MDDFDLYRLFKTLHVISVVMLGGGFVLEGICGPLVARAKTMGEVRAYARLISSRRISCRSRPPLVSLCSAT